LKVWKNERVEDNEWKIFFPTGFVVNLTDCKHFLFYLFANRNLWTADAAIVKKHERFNGN
jgi:hypothetical protein